MITTPENFKPYLPVSLTTAPKRVGYIKQFSRRENHGTEVIDYSTQEHFLAKTIDIARDNSFVNRAAIHSNIRSLEEIESSRDKYA